MTVAEIFKELSGHMLKGLMTHEELANYYDFLALKGYKRCHEYHLMKEMCSYRALCRYYINHYNELIPYVEIEQPDVIPQSWYSHTREDADPVTKRDAVRQGLLNWVEWEKETKEFYQKMYTELINIGEVAGADMVMELIRDVDCELKKAQRYLLNKLAVDFDMTLIIEEQSKKHKKYQRKMEKELKVHIC